MKKILLLLCLIGTAACAPKFKDMQPETLKQEDGMLLVNYEYMFDGSEESNCHMFGDGADNKKIEVVGMLDNQTKLILIPGGGDVYLNSAMCMAYKVLFNKTRTRLVTPPLKVHVYPGTITYPGTLMADWDSEDVGLADILINGGGLTEDQGAFLMKLEDRSQEMLALLQKENPALLERFTLVKGRYEDNPNLLQPRLEPAEPTQPAPSTNYLAPTTPDGLPAQAQPNPGTLPQTMQPLP